MKQNNKALLELADFIESGKYNFEMDTYMAKPSCGCAGCIGGHAAVLWPSIQDKDPAYGPDEVTWEPMKFANKLGLSRSSATVLCYPGSNQGISTDYSEVTRAAAVRAIRNLIKTGEVWFEVNE